MQPQKNIIFAECQQKYFQCKGIIDQFIIQTLFFEFSESNHEKYTSYLNHIIRTIYDPKYESNQQIQEDDLLFDRLTEQFLVIQDCKEMFIQYLENFDEYNEEQIDKIKLYYFKVTYFYLFCLDIQNREEIKSQYKLLSEHNENLISDIISQIEDLRGKYNQNTANKIHNKQINEKSYNDQLPYQNFHMWKCQKQSQYFESQIIKPNQIIQNRANAYFSEEIQFFQDFFNCLQIIFENLKILKLQQEEKENTISLCIYLIFRKVGFEDLVKKYSLQEYFQLFSKFNILTFMFDLHYFEKLNQDEAILYFYVLTGIYLHKNYNWLFNIEQNLSLVMNKINSFEGLKNNAGLIFTMQLIKDLKEKDCLDEELYELFNDWNNQPAYQVQETWINKEYIQLTIDAAQNIIKLLAIPELARFYFKYNQNIPIQISNQELAIAQHILIGKQFYLRHPHQLTDLLTFWQELNNEITQIFVEGSQNDHIEQMSQSYNICQINIIMCKILLEKEQNKYTLLNELDNHIDSFMKLMNCNLYQNIYRMKQLFYTLQSLFIEDDIVIPIIIKKLQHQKVFYDKQYDKNNTFLIISLQNDFKVNSIINANEFQNYKMLDSKELSLFKDKFMKVRNKMKSYDKDRKTTLKYLQNIFEEFKFLKKPQFNVFKLNIDFYIKQIELELEYKKEIQFKYLKLITKSQFKIDLVEIDIDEQRGKTVIRKRMTDKDKRQQLKYIVNECSILLQLQKHNKNHKNIIELIDYNSKDGEIELFLQYCENGSLKSYLEKNKLTSEQKICICIDILEGVQHLHEINILHGDLKLDNIVVNSEGIIKIIDFGSSDYLIHECNSFSFGYQSSDIQQSLYSDYFGIGIILFSVLLNNNTISNNYQEFKRKKEQIQNKKLLKEYFYISKQKDIIDKEYSPSLFKAILSLFNDQPYLRPKLSELIEILNNHKNQSDEIKMVDQIKYSIKKSISKLQQQNKDPYLVQLVIEKYFHKKQQKQNNKNKQDQLNQQNDNIQNNITLYYSLSDIKPLQNEWNSNASQTMDFLGTKQKEEEDISNKLNELKNENKIIMNTSNESNTIDRLNINKDLEISQNGERIEEEKEEALNKKDMLTENEQSIKTEKQKHSFQNDTINSQEIEQVDNKQNTQDNVVSDIDQNNNQERVDNIFYNLDNILSDILSYIQTLNDKNNFDDLFVLAGALETENMQDIMNIVKTLL